MTLGIKNSEIQASLWSVLLLAGWSVSEEKKQTNKTKPSAGDLAKRLEKTGDNERFQKIIAIYLAATIKKPNWSVSLDERLGRRLSGLPDTKDV